VAFEEKPLTEKCSCLYAESTKSDVIEGQKEKQSRNSGYETEGEDDNKQKC
jgi:hypothetical protein